MPYSVFVNRMDQANIELNRKVVADIAANEPFSFRSIMSVLGTIDEGGVVANNAGKN